MLPLLENLLLVPLVTLPPVYQMQMSIHLVPSSSSDLRVDASTSMLDNSLSLSSSILLKESFRFGFAPQRFGIFGFAILILPKTFEEPVATDVQPVIPSPTLPQPFPFTKTVVEPVVIGAA